LNLIYIMSLFNFLKEKLYIIDIFGLNIKFRYNGHSSIKSIPGGLISFGLLIFFTYIIIYIGEDLIYKEKPITGFSKEHNETVGVKLEDYPYSFYFFDPVKNFRIANSDKYFTMSASWFHLYMGGPGSGVISYSLDVEKCTENHVLAYKEAFTQNVDFNYTWCINPSQYNNGTSTMKDDVYFLNEYSSIGSAFVLIRIRDCLNSTANGNGCASQTEINEVRNSLSIATYFMDSYINLNKFDNPGNMFLNRYVYAAPKDVQKIAYHRVKNINLFTDSGLVFDDTKTTPMLQVERIYSEVVTREYFFSIILEGSRIKDNYYRKYIKIQDIMAYTGGLFDMIFWIGNTIFIYLYEKSFKIEVFNNYYSVKSNPLKLPHLTPSKAVSNISANSLQIINVNNFVNPTVDKPKLPAKRKSRPSLVGFLKSRLLCMLNRFKVSQYDSIIKLVNQNFEIMELFKSYTVNRYIQNKLLSEEQRKESLMKDSIHLLRDKVYIVTDSERDNSNKEVSYINNNDK
jgi:hypothetical protein